MKRTLAMALMVMSTVAFAADDFKATYKLTMTQTAQHPYGVGAQKLADIVKERTNGRIQIKPFNDSVLAKGEREMLEGLQQGTIDIYVGSTGPVGNFSPSMLIVDIPFLFRDNAHVDKVLDGPIGKQLLADVDKSGFKGLAFWENGWRHLTNNKVAAKTPEEAKGLKIRTMENKAHILAFKTAGLNPTPMAYSEVYSALQVGVIDGQENPVAVFYASKLYETQKYFALTGHVYSPALVLFSQKKWDRIPKDDQEIIAKAAQEVALFERKLNRDDEEKKLKEMEGKGLVVVRDVNKPAWQKSMQPAFDEFAKQFGKDKIDAIINTK
ncbi:TRAP transporter substrate-binding protein [Propionivibrio dicarboxylicus]|uniref:Tripartite ATP-independent transporter solute receptor, DctP family n=1 Tax=Propionivibrio dicarboxylicus TaxID=83767 RepID=A0A1G8KSV7_9RHOO|nr:TRAP transporter substrate-binding protein [Propionivibrio dicarboxylicus]SDI46477.1 tripartite ATP-independent transporter solute receptor, DctP family [Propionivibrio dicarboxylicus]